MSSRWKRGRVWAGLGTLAVTSLVAALAAGSAAPARNAAQASDTIVIAIPGTPQGVDIDGNSGPQTWSMTAQVLDPPMDWARVKNPYPPAGGVDNSKIPGYTYPDFKHLNMAPGLFTGCDLKNGGKLALYHIRHGVKSAWGNELTADDVIFRQARAIANKRIGLFMVSVANAADLNQWKKIDKYTVQITSKTPMPLICQILPNLYWQNIPDSVELKKHITKDDPWGNQWMAFHGTYFGAYYITKWVPGQEVDMEANPNYWNGPLPIKHIIYKVVPESSNRVALLQNGSVQMVEGLSPEDIVSLNKKTGVHVAAVRGNQSLWLEMNNTVKPFDNVKVRQAINYAIPRQQIVDNVYRGFAQEWQGVMPSVYPGYKDFKTYSFDVAKAKKLLAEAGYAKGFKDVLTYSAGDPVQANIAVLLQSTLKQIGVDLTLQQQPPGPYADVIQGHKFHMGLWIDFPIQPDINYDLTLANKTGAAVNYQLYSNPKVDAILQKCLSVVGAQRIPCNQAAAKIISDTASLGWIAEPYYLSAMSDKLAGWGWYTTQYYRVATLKYAS